MKKHILLIDDDEDELKIFTEALDKVPVPCKCTWARSGKQALRQLPYLAPHMVFLDLNMPGMDGFEALSAIRQLPNCRDVPIILYSTAMDRADHLKGIGLGATACISKQGSIKALTDTLSGILSGGAAANI